MASTSDLIIWNLLVNDGKSCSIEIATGYYKCFMYKPIYTFAWLMDLVVSPGLTQFAWLKDLVVSPRFTQFDASCDVPIHYFSLWVKCLSFAHWWMNHLSQGWCEWIKWPQEGIWVLGFLVSM